MDATVMEFVVKEHNRKLVNPMKFLPHESKIEKIVLQIVLIYGSFYMILI